MPAARKPPVNDSESVIPMPPLHIQRRLTHSVDGISVWSDPACRATVQHHHADERPPPEPPPDPHPTNPPDKHHIGHWGDLGLNLCTRFRTTDKLWVWCPPGNRIRDPQDLRCCGSIQDFELQCTTSLRVPHPVQHLRLSLLFDEYGKCNMRHVHPPHSKHIFCGLQFQM